MDKPLLELSNVSFTYPGAEHPVLLEVSFTLQQGDFAVIGSNGSGKSTLCKCFNGLIPHYYTGDFEGELKLLGESAEEKRVSELSRHIGYVYQDFENQLVRPTVLDDVCFTPLNYGLADYRERGLRALELTGLSGLSREFIWQLSGGQKHLLALAGALAMDPTFSSSTSRWPSSIRSMRVRSTIYYAGSMSSTVRPLWSLSITRSSLRSTAARWC